MNKTEERLKIADNITLWLIIVGALVWGILVFSGVNIVERIFTNGFSWVTMTIYWLVGLSGVWTGIRFFIKKN